MTLDVEEIVDGTVQLSANLSDQTMKVVVMKPLKQLPSEYVKQHIYWGFFDDPIGVKLRHEIGVDRIIWGGDFPHVESAWPNSGALLDRLFKGVPADEQAKMVAGNAAKFIHL